MTVHDPADVLRRFNRSYTRRIGVLHDRFLGLDRPLATSRLLWEISDSGRRVSDLRRTLDLDSAYLSRLLRRLEHDGLIAMATDPADRRRRVVVLTADGRREWNELEARSQTLAESLIASLGSGQRQRLSEALTTADRLLSAAAVTIEPVDPLDEAALDALTNYFDELNRRFESGFDPGDALTSEADAYRSPEGAFLLARSNGSGETVACGAVHRLDVDIAEIKRMWVNPAWRGLGLGRRMLSHLEHAGASLGCSVLRLDTNSALTEAIEMYRSSGYEPIERYNDNPFAKCWFEKHP